jgi:hypothetical protein
MRCNSNQNCRSFLFNHSSDLKTCKGIASHFRVSLAAFISLESFSRLDISSTVTDALSFILWLFLMGIINACELPDRQWYVDGLMPIVDRMQIGSWKEMKECLSWIMWLEAWHDGVGEMV